MRIFVSLIQESRPASEASALQRAPRATRSARKKMQVFWLGLSLASPDAHFAFGVGLLQASGGTKFLRERKRLDSSSGRNSEAQSAEASREQQAMRTRITIKASLRTHGAVDR